MAKSGPKPYTIRQELLNKLLALEAAPKPSSFLWPDGDKARIRSAVTNFRRAGKIAGRYSIKWTPDRQGVTICPTPTKIGAGNQTLINTIKRNKLVLVVAAVGENAFKNVIRSWQLAGYIPKKSVKQLTGNIYAVGPLKGFALSSYTSPLEKP